MSMHAQGTSRGAEPPGPNDGLRLALVIPFLGMLLAGIADILVGMWVAPGLLMGTAEHIGLVLHTLARDMIVAAGIAAALIAVLLADRIATPLTRVRILEPIVLVWTVILGTGFITYNEATWSGAKISQNPNVELYRWVTQIGGPVGIYIGLIVFRWFQRQLQAGQGGILWKIAGVGSCGVMFGLVWVNLTQQTNRYEDVHTQLACISILFGLASALALVHGTFLDPARSRKATRVVLASAALVILLGGICMRLDRFPRVRVAERRITAVTNEFNEITSRILAPFSKIRSDIPLGELPELGEIDAATVQAYLDEHLPKRKALNVVWIAIDTLRHDHTGFTPVRNPDGTDRTYDHNPTTPRLDALAESSYVFRNAYTTYPTSNFAYASALSGLLPRATLNYNTKYGMKWTFPEGTSVAEVLETAGRQTTQVNAFNQASARDIRWFGHMRRGFDVYNPDQTEANSTSRGVTDSMIGQLEQIRGKPFFAFMHYLAPHDPYNDPENEIRFDTGSETDGYDSDIREVDTHVGRLLDALKDQGLWDETAVIIFSDHGESFGEHGATKHNGNLFDDQIHVPLVIRIPGVQGRVVDALASIADLGPTTLSLLGIEDPLPRHGRDLLPYMLMKQAPPRYVMAERFKMLGGEQDEQSRALLFGDHKLIEIDSYPDPEYHLYNLKNDPKEQKNLYSLPEHAQAERELLAILKVEFPKIDAYHANLAGEVAKSPKQRWLEQLQAIRKRLHDPDVKVTVAAMKEMDGTFFFDGYDEISVQTQRFLGQDEIRTLAFEIRDLAIATKNKSLEGRFLRFMHKMAIPELAPFWKERLDGKSESRAVFAAFALARLRDNSGEAVLVKALGKALTYDFLGVSVSLGLIGNKQGTPALRAALHIPNYKQLVAIMQALDILDLPETASWTRDFVYFARWNAHRLQKEIIKAVSHNLENAQAQEVLLHYARFRHADLRSEALSLLEKVWSPEQLDRNLGALDHFSDARQQAKYGRWAEAENYLAQACAKATIPFPVMRIFRGQVLRAMGRNEDALKVFDEVARIAPSQRDRAQAKGLAAHVRAGAPPFLERDDFNITLVKGQLPNLDDPRLRGSLAAMQFRVKNTSKHAIAGGNTLFSSKLIISFDLADGKKYAPRRAHYVEFPPAGIGPGEEATVTVAFRVPSKPIKRLILSAHMPYRHYYLEPKVVITLEVPKADRGGN